MRNPGIALAIGLLWLPTVFAQAPLAPHLSISSKGTQISLAWTKAAGADGYTLIYADYPNANQVSSLDMQAALTAVGELPPGSAFYVGLQAHNEAGSSLMSNISFFAISDEERPTAGDVCSADLLDTRYAWPFQGQNGREWVITNYVDQNPGVGISDYRSEAGVSGKSYDGHNGIDIAIPTFREMDSGVNIYAIHSGLVVEVEESFPDRNTSCVSNQWNTVTVEQNDGNRVYYGHLKTNSAVVEPGQQVAKGELLGQVGSSGCSTAPHLHLELRSGSNGVVDPFLTNQWCDAPAYEPPVTVFTGVLLEAPANQYTDALKDPPADINAIAVGRSLLPILHSANGSIGDTVGVRVLNPIGDVHIESAITFSNAERHGSWVFNAGIVDQAGVWTVHFLANNVLQYALQVSASDG